MPARQGHDCAALHPLSRSRGGSHRALDSVPYLTMRCLAVRSLTVTFPAAPFLAVPFLAVPFPTVRFLTVPCPTVPFLDSTASARRG